MEEEIVCEGKLVAFGEAYEPTLPTAHRRTGFECGAYDHRPLGHLRYSRTPQTRMGALGQTLEEEYHIDKDVHICVSKTILPEKLPLREKHLKHTSPHPTKKVEAFYRTKSSTNGRKTIKNGGKRIGPNLSLVYITLIWSLRIGIWGDWE